MALHQPLSCDECYQRRTDFIAIYLSEKTEMDSLM